MIMIIMMTNKSNNDGDHPSVPRSQLLITFSIAGVQLVATVVWCLVHLPGAFFYTEYLLSKDPKDPTPTILVFDNTLLLQISSMTIPQELKSY